jgi:hypothetical protein
MRRLLLAPGLWLICALAPLACRTQAVHDRRAPQAAPATRQVADARSTLEFLASDELEGRGVGTAGLDRAADYIADQFSRAGLRPLPARDDFFQPFQMTTASEVGPGTALRFGSQELAPGKDFTPLSISAEGAFAGKVVFAGYGISSEKFKYDDYAGIDVRGKIVLAMRFEPHDDKEKSRFTGDQWSPEAHLVTKARVAQDHGAAALLLVTPPDHKGDEALMPFGRAMGRDRKIAIIHVTTAVADDLLKRETDKDLAALEEAINKTGKPTSIDLEAVELSGKVEIKRKEVTVKNVLACLPGRGPHADEYVVIGGHYDHLGRGGIGSLAPTTRAIHHGADDNASGVTAIIQIAAHMAKARPLDRSLIFAAFTAEEEGVIGSEHFVDHPPVPLARITAMINLDMVGRMKDQTLYVGGTGTAAPFESLVNRAAAESPAHLKTWEKGGIGPSDHMSFALKRIPVIFLWTGLHPDYHRPTDTADKINYTGLEEATDLAEKIIEEVAALPRQSYVSAFDSSSMMTGSHAGSGASLGVIPDYGQFGAGGGVKIMGTSPGSPAEKAGLEPGDIIVKFADTKIETLYNLTGALANSKPGQLVHLKIQRTGKTIETDATLTKRKQAP